MAKKTVKETIHAKGIDIGIYTSDFQNEYISLAFDRRSRVANRDKKISVTDQNRRETRFYPNRELEQ